jgi:hypothetical protein
VSAPAPDARSAAPEPGPTQAPKPPRAWLITFAVLAVVLVVSAIVLLLVVRPPSYEPVPIPSVGRT